jgi:putative acetyltransferase
MTSGTVIEIRTAKPEDFGNWLELFESVAGEGKWLGAELPLDREARRRTFDEHIFSDDSSTFLAEAGSRLVGILGIRIEIGIAHLGMAVAADCRNQGVGSLLLESAISWAAGKGAHKVALELWPNNLAAKSLYLKFGFEQEGLLNRHYLRRNGELWDAVVMGLVIDRGSPGGPPDGNSK